eukprot:TRINITY_DN1956_c0_g1_i2.p1 TRINITY_DN1956_c0_g1~~TRINITY_DN1956_c0_g1_i2.p1  ORF type:complete len:617 (-),score=291.59 TRINITY_DN1956_c0_g1_i2:474-2324(-)
MRCQELQDELVAKEKEWSEKNQSESKKRTELEDEKKKLLDVNFSLMEKLKSSKAPPQNSSQKASQEATISYTFRWPYGGKELAVAGDWNEWKAIPMEKKGEEFVVKVEGLKPLNRYLYKYVVDGVWQEDHTSPVSQEEMVNGNSVINNVLVTGPLDSDERISQLEKERDSLFRMNKQLEAAAKKNLAPQDNSKWENQIEELQNKLSEAQNLQVQLKKESEELKSSLESSKKQVSSSETEIKETQLRHEKELQSQFEKLNKENQEALSKSSAEKQLNHEKELKELTEKKEKELKELRDSISKQSNQKDDSEKRFKEIKSSHEKELAQLNLQLENGRQRSGELEKQLESLKSQISNDKKDMEGKEKESEKKQRELLNQLEEAKKQYRGEHEGKEREFKANEAKEAEIRELKKELENLRKESNNQLAASKEESNVSANRAKNLDERLKLKEVECEKHILEANSLKEELRAKFQSVAEESGKKNNANGEIKGLQDELKTARDEIKVLISLLVNSQVVIKTNLALLRVIHSSPMKLEGADEVLGRTENIANQLADNKTYLRQLGGMEASLSERLKEVENKERQFAVVRQVEKVRLPYEWFLYGFAIPIVTASAYHLLKRKR